MFDFFLKTIFSGIIIAFCSWLSYKKPQLAGFIIALPLISIITLAFSYIEHQNKTQTIIFAKSIFVGIPASLLFFVPFLFSKYLTLNFWGLFCLGIIFSILLSYYSKEITSLLFFRGNFTSEDLNQVSELFKYFTYLIPFYLVIVIILTFFYGNQKIKIVFIICMLTLIFKLVYLFTVDEITISSLPLSTLFGFSASIIFIFCILFYEIRHEVNRIFSN